MGRIPLVRTMGNQLSAMASLFAERLTGRSGRPLALSLLSAVMFVGCVDSCTLELKCDGLVVCSALQ